MLTESEWYNRRLYNKYCDDGDCSTIDQDTFHVKRGKKFTRSNSHSTTQRGETEPLKNRQGFKFATNNFRDDFEDDHDGDDKDDERQEDYIRVQRNFGKTSRRDTKQFHEKKFAEKHTRGQHYQQRNSQQHQQRLNRKPHRQHLVNMMHNYP